MPKKGTLIFRLIIVACILIYGYLKYGIEGVRKAKKPEPDINRVNTDTGTFDLTYRELVDLIKQCDPKLIIETTPKSEINENNGKKIYYKTVNVSSHTINCYSNEEDGKLIAVTVASLPGSVKKFKQVKNEKGIPQMIPESITFKSSDTKGMRYHAEIVNNILNSYSTQKDFRALMKENINKKITEGEGEIGDSKVFFYLDSRNLVVEFIPLKINN